MNLTGGFSRSWMNSIQTSGSLRLTWRAQNRQVHEREKIESKDSRKRCEISSRPRTELTGSGIEKKEIWSEYCACLSRVAGYHGCVNAARAFPAGLDSLLTLRRFTMLGNIARLLRHFKLRRNETRRTPPEQIGGPWSRREESQWRIKPRKLINDRSRGPTSARSMRTAKLQA